MKTFIDVVKTNNYERLRSTAGILGNKFIVWNVGKYMFYKL